MVCQCGYPKEAHGSNPYACKAFTYSTFLSGSPITLEQLERLAKTYDGKKAKDRQRRRER